MKSVKRCLALSAVVSCSMIITACTSMHGEQCSMSDAEPAPATPAMKTAPEPAPMAAEGDQYQDKYVKIHQKMPSEVRVGQPFTYEVLIKNDRSQYGVIELVATQVGSKNFEYQSAEPPPTGMNAKGMPYWEIGNLEAGAEYPIMVTGIPQESGPVGTCYKVSYDEKICAGTQAVAPELKLVKVATPEVLICEPITVTVTVTNSGTGTVKDLKVTDTLPEGLMTEKGNQQVMVNIPELGPGASKTFTYQAKASKAGTYDATVQAAAADDLTASAMANTIVKAPVLEVSQTVTDEVFIGRTIETATVVKNTGDGVAQNLVVRQVLPGGVTLIGVTKGYTLEQNVLTWNLTDLAPGQKIDLNASYKTGRIGDVKTSVEAKAKCAEAATDSGSTKVNGVPAILLEVVDVDDPVEVGENETYIITATNQGTAKDTNIIITCTLEENQEFVSGGGATEVESANGNTITFKPLASLDSKDKAVWKVVIKNVKAGDVRFKTVMNTDQLERPVEETEATYVY